MWEKVSINFGDTSNQTMCTSQHWTLATFCLLMCTLTCKYSTKQHNINILIYPHYDIIYLFSWKLLFEAVRKLLEIMSILPIICTDLIRICCLCSLLIIGNNPLLTFYPQDKAHIIMLLLINFSLDLNHLFWMVFRLECTFL